MADNKKPFSFPEKYCDLSFKQPVRSWDEALPLGNGLIGCLIWGDGAPLKFSLDRGDLWDNRPAPETLEADFTYEKLVECVRSKDQDAIRKKFNDAYYNPTPTKIPVGNLSLDFGKKADCVESGLCLSRAEARVNLFFDKDKVSVESYLHAVKRSGFIRISGYKQAPSILLRNPGFGNINDEAGKKGEVIQTISNGSLKQLKYPEPQIGEAGDIKWFIQKTAEDLEYGVIAASRINDGSIELVYGVASCMDGINWFDDAYRSVLDDLETGYGHCMKEHEKWWADFWDKSAIRLSDKEFEKQWYLTNYLFGSCSRKNAPPMPLQGVWTADDGELPPWKGDYHNDLNTQMSYWHYLKANHIEEGESFINFLWALAPAARKFSKEFFNAPGLCLPAVMTIDGKPLCGWPMYTLNLTNQIWLCQAFARHWQYTGDKDFLENKAYPYMKETADCIMRWLEPDKEGKLLLPLSSSPEIHDDELESWLTPNSNFDLSLLRYLFKTLAEMSEVLDNGKKEFWLDKLESMHELAVNDKDVLMISPDESLQESHRHFSHAMAVYPLKLLDYHGSEKDRRIIDATVRDLERLGTGLWVGFSFTWMAELYAIQGNGEGAAYQLKLFRENLCSQNGFHLNGDYKKHGVTAWHYRPFTLESNMCAADALQEMLLQTDGGVIRVFPAIPDEWREKGALFRDLRGRDGVLISSSVKGGKVDSIVLREANPGEYSVKNVFGSGYAVAKRKKCRDYIQCNEDGNFTIWLDKGEKCIIQESGPKNA